MIRSFIVAGPSRPAWTEGGLRSKRVGPTRPLWPRGRKIPRSSPPPYGQALDQRKEGGPRDTEAVARLAHLARAPTERLGFRNAVQEPLDRAGRRGHVSRLHHE